MKLEVRDLEDVFQACFSKDFRTVLIGGGAEPLYLPSEDPEHVPHRLIYREDYFASALHEIAHWCLAGAARRKREDYGYWYSPDGRTSEEQAAFERVEVAPQALEWILSDACEFTFQLSADNLALGVGASRQFERSVEAKKERYLQGGLPSRADTYRRALRGLIRDRRDPSRSLLGHPPYRRS